MKKAVILTVVAAFFATQSEPTAFTQVCAVISGIAALYCIVKKEKQGNNNRHLYTKRPLTGSDN